MNRLDQLRQKYPNLIPIPELRASVSIIELAICWGYELKRQKGKNRPVLEHAAFNDKIIIKNPENASQQVYQQSGNFSDAGTIIDFVRNRLTTVFSSYNLPGQHELTNITHVLYDYLQIDPSYLAQNRTVPDNTFSKKVDQTFDVDQFDLRPLENDNYLIQRHIRTETIRRPEFIGKVVAQITYFDPVNKQAVDFATAKTFNDQPLIQFSNIAFPYYDGQSSRVTGLELRNQHIKLHAAGSDRQRSVFVSNPPSPTKHFYVMESVIDILSHRELRSLNGDEAFDSVYFSIGGQLVHQQVTTILRYISTIEKTSNFSLYLAFDNDLKGYEYDLLFIQLLTAERFPITLKVSTKTQLIYALPTHNQYNSLCNILLDHIKQYNQRFSANSVLPLNPLRKQSVQLIQVGAIQQVMQINVPKTKEALSAFCNYLIEVSDLAVRLKITKANGKDYNDDLSLRLNC